jgi:hypothetical protein
MSKYICTCEDELYRQTCSEECDLCGLAEPIDEGQGDGVRCNCCGALITDSNYRLCTDCQLK